MMVSALPEGPAAPIAEDAAASARRIEADVGLVLENLSPGRRAVLVGAASARYRTALILGTTAAWRRFADAVHAALRAAAKPAPGSYAISSDAYLRLQGFLAENPDLAGERGFARLSR